jgi:hypothetical protein
MYGLDLLGIAKFGDVAFREYPEGWALGAFAEEFGFSNAHKWVKAIIETGRCPLLRMQLTWSRQNHTFNDDHFKIAKKQAAVYEALAVANKKTVVELSTFCEHNLDNPDRYHDEIARIAPHCRIVNSVYKGKLSKKYKNEVHGPTGAPRGAYNYSFDGTGCVDADVAATRRAHQKCEVFFFWTYQFNGKRNGSTTDDHGKPLPYIEPTERKFWPTGTLLDSVIYLHRARGKVELPNRYTYKSHSDQQNPEPVGRELKPVLIAPPKIGRYELVAENGQVVAVLPYYGTYKDGRHRYYANEWGFNIAEKAKRIQGHSVLKLRGNGKVVGTLNPAFRQNDYRK